MWGLRRWLSMSMSMSIGDVFWRFCFAVAANLFSIFCQALSSHNSHCIMCGLRGQTLDPTDATHNTQHTRGLHAILNGFIDTLGCRNNKLSRGSGRGRGQGYMFANIGSNKCPAIFQLSPNEPIKPSIVSHWSWHWSCLLVLASGRFMGKRALSLLCASFANFDFNDLSARPELPNWILIS